MDMYLVLHVVNNEIMKPEVYHTKKEAYSFMVSRCNDVYNDGLEDYNNGCDPVEPEFSIDGSSASVSTGNCVFSWQIVHIDENYKNPSTFCLNG